MNYRTIVADPPWQFSRQAGRGRATVPYQTMDLERICSMGPQVLELMDEQAHLYLWVPTPLLNWGLQVMAAWGVPHKSAVYWVKVRKDGEIDGSGMGGYFRSAAEMALFGVRGRQPTAHRDVTNVVKARRGRHSEKPEAFYRLVEHQSPGPYLEMFARTQREGWDVFGNEVKGSVLISTDKTITLTWRAMISDIMDGKPGPMDLKDIYRAAHGYGRTNRAIELGVKWESKIRRVLQEHFKPAGRGIWGTA